MIQRELIYEYWTEEKSRISKLNISPLFELDSKLEEHHIFGKINSNETVLIPKNRHKFITDRLNILPRKYRINPEIILLINIFATLELCAFEIRHYLFLKMHNVDDESINFLQERNLSIEKLKDIVRILWRLK
jgi:hypothetical protein